MTLLLAFRASGMCDWLVDGRLVRRSPSSKVGLVLNAGRLYGLVKVGVDVDYTL